MISFLVVASFILAQSSSDKEKRLGYNDVTEGSGAIDRGAKGPYVGKFQFIDIKQRKDFLPPVSKGVSRRRSDSEIRVPGDSATRGKAVYVFIVTPDGRILGPRILRSTDERVSKYIHRTS
jgi:hypothetical protein